MKKRKGRRKAATGKGKARKAAVTREPVRSTEAKLAGSPVSRREQSPWQHGLTALGAVDWLAVAICVLPLVAMALTAQAVNVLAGLVNGVAALIFVFVADVA